jgi:hypothetical protein
VDTPSAIALVGIALAWGIYRLERTAARRREIDGALATIRAVKRGMVGDEERPGWGELYFSAIYDDKAAMERARQDVEQINKRAFNQVFVVPSEPLRVIASTTHGGDLISDETIRAANNGLWHVGIFNQLVESQTNWLTQHAVEIGSEETTEDRRKWLAGTGGSIAHFLHWHGVGGANLPGGWYHDLKRAVDQDVTRLSKVRSRIWNLGEWWIAAGDALVTATVVGLGVWLLTML